MDPSHAVSPTVIDGIEALRAHVGIALGPSSWRTITQDEVNVFAAMTGDEQWIHLDQERAAATPIGGTVAHGFLTLALGAGFCHEIVALEGFQFAMNYGLNRVRFTAPMPVGERVRMRGHIEQLEETPQWAQFVIVMTFEREHHERPVAVAELVVRAVR